MSYLISSSLIYKILSAQLIYRLNLFQKTTIFALFLISYEIRFAIILMIYLLAFHNSLFVLISIWHHNIKLCFKIEYSFVIRNGCLRGKLRVYI